MCDRIIQATMVMSISKQEWTSKETTGHFGHPVPAAQLCEAACQNPHHSLHAYETYSTEVYKMYGNVYMYRTAFSIQVPAKIFHIRNETEGPKKRANRNTECSGMWLRFPGLCHRTCGHFKRDREEETTVSVFFHLIYIPCTTLVYITFSLKTLCIVI